MIITLSKKMDIEFLKQALPNVDKWIDEYINKKRNTRRRVIDAGFTRLNGCFSSYILQRAYYSVVDKIETPPLSELGLEQLSFFEDGGYGGITYKDTYFVTEREKEIESLHFHEMVHVVQWDELGAETFLVLYAVGLIKFGYRESPLEKIAYSLQERFDQGESFFDLDQYIRVHSQKLKKSMG